MSKLYDSQNPSDGAPPSPFSSDRKATNTQSAKGTWLSPISAGLILFLDNLFFAGNLSSGMLATPLISALAFASTSTAVFFVQKVRVGDRFRSAIAKAILSGCIAAIPSSIAGTAFGSLVLFLSGMHALSRRS